MRRLEGVAAGEALAGLAPRARGLVLHRSKGLTNPEIAELEGLAITSVEAQMSLARRSLREALAG